jgi:hypothetical protein
MTLTRAQKVALIRLYRRNADGHASYLSFRRSIVPGICGDDYVGILWCGMFIGIERDGHTHS